MVHVAVIGGGPCGVACSAAILEQHASAQLVLVGGGGSHGSLAWHATTPKEMLINLPAQFATVVEGGANVASFAKVGLFDFPPRESFAAFLDAQAVEVCAREIERVTHYHDAVCDRVELSGSESGRYTVVLSNGISFTAYAVVLAVGQATRAPAFYAPGISSSQVCVNYPLEAGALSAIPSGARVGVIGTGLSAVDVAKHLLQRRERCVASVVMASRRGLLPMPTNYNGFTRTPYERQFVTLEAIHRVVADTGGPHVQGLLDLFVAMVRKEMQAAEPNHDWWAATQASGGVELLRAAMRRQADGLSDRWFLALVSISGAGLWGVMWRLLIHEEKRRFLSEFGTLAQVLMNPMPLESCRALVSLVDEGRLEVRQQFSSVESTMDGFAMRCGGEDIIVSHVVNAAGVSMHFDKDTSQPLLTGLVQQGLLIPDPFGGFVCDDQTLRAKPASTATGSEDQVQLPGIFVAGHLARGSQLFTSGLRECREHAKLISNSLVFTIREE